MKGIYGDNMPVARGKKHTYVGIYIDYSLPGKANVSTDNYITEAIDKFSEEMMQKIKTTAGNHPTINSVKIHLKANNLNVVHWWVDISCGN